MSAYAIGKIDISNKLHVYAKSKSDDFECTKLDQYDVIKAFRCRKTKAVAAVCIM
jgi:hypothetical protein